MNFGKRFKQVLEAKGPKAAAATLSPKQKEKMLQLLLKEKKRPEK